MGPTARSGLSWLCAVLIAGAITSLGGLPPGAAAEPESEVGNLPNGLCLICHSAAGITATLEEEERPVTPINPETFKASAHGEEDCVSCHEAQSTLPHFERDAQLLEDASNASDAAVCGKCHEEAYEGYLRSVHGTMAKLDYEKGPACADCHGNAHEAQPLEDWTEHERAEVCSGCHPGASPNFLAAVSHEEPSPGFLPFAYFAENFLVILTAGALAFAIIHVELEMLRWLTRRLGARFGRHSGE